MSYDSLSCLQKVKNLPLPSTVQHTVLTKTCCIKILHTHIHPLLPLHTPPPTHTHPPQRLCKTIMPLFTYRWRKMNMNKAWVYIDHIMNLFYHYFIHWKFQNHTKLHVPFYTKVWTFFFVFSSRTNNHTFPILHSLSLRVDSKDLSTKFEDEMGRGDEQKPMMHCIRQ